MNSTALRLLDANLNRAREGLRVVEDYARFVLNDHDLCGRLKTIRHELVEATASVGAEAIVHRDTPGDVGIEVKTLQEARRAELSEIVIAAGKRVGEALRAIEESLKLLLPGAAPAVERARYGFYSLEQRVALTLGQSRRFERVQLYVLITEATCRRPWLETAELALRGGADALQLREKSLDGGELLQRARALTALCRRYDALCLINDRCDIALLSDADGVHLGQSDLPLAEARRMIGRQKLIGISTHNLQQAQAAFQGGADYIGVGPCFASSTKSRSFVAGCDWLGDVAREVPIPAVAIAGITRANVDEVLRAGVHRVAVTAAIASSDDPQQAAAELKSRLRERGTGSDDNAKEAASSPSPGIPGKGRGEGILRA